MARKQDSWINTLILAPWWVSILLAGGSYVVLGKILPAALVSSMPMRVIGSMTGTVGPIFSVALLFIAAVSAIRRLKVRGQLERQQSVNTLAELSWKSFEDVTGEYFRRRGYRVIETLGGGADGGVDLRLQKDDELTLVQCKRWKSRKVGLPIVRELLGAITAESAQNGILVTTSDFTVEAIQFAKQQGIRLIDGKQLATAIADIQAAHNSPAETQADNSIIPHCSKCGSGMIKRIAKTGANAGNAFWGCSQFPKCRGTQNFNSDGQFSWSDH